ncbi:MAG: class I tRNA ligase family protein [Planctomycetes bacterium]|nr:class I tRNA ligase family protein [Planctomycetota bacterium]
MAAQAYKTDPGIFAEAFTGEGVAVNSGEFDGAPSMEFTRRIVSWLAERGLGRGSVNTKLRDWVFSRQKYWGEPFPVIHGDDGEVVALSEDELPLELPSMPDFKRPVSEDPDVMPEPPLGRTGDWVKVTRDGKSYHRDLNTMPQWAGSCWYYLRYLDPHNKQRICSPEAEHYWMPVDMYVGGAEHAVLHLLYARFWHKVLHDLGHVSTSEPFGKLINQGMIQGFAYRDGRGTLLPSDRVEEQADGTFRSRQTGEPVTQIIAKMSKSLGNVVSPDDIVAQFGADAFRMYEMYMGPIEASKPWQTRDVPGLFKLLNRVWRLVVDEQTDSLSPALCDDEPGDEVTRCLHKTIKKIGADVEQFKFNTAIAAMFDFVNTITPCEKRPRSVIGPFVLLLAPFAPHIAEELWQRLGHDESLTYQPWPEYDEALACDEQVEIAVQINGKLRSRVTVDTDADRAACEAAARADSRIGELIEGKTVRKVIVVPGRLVNIIVG